MSNNGILSFITERYREAESPVEKEQLSSLFWIAADNHLDNCLGERNCEVDGDIVPIS